MSRNRNFSGVNEDPLGLPNGMAGRRETLDAIHYVELSRVPVVANEVIFQCTRIDLKLRNGSLPRFVIDTCSIQYR